MLYTCPSKVSCAHHAWAAVSTHHPPPPSRLPPPRTTWPLAHNAAAHSRHHSVARMSRFNANRRVRSYDSPPEGEASGPRSASNIALPRRGVSYYHTSHTTVPYGDSLASPAVSLMRAVCSTASRCWTASTAASHSGITCASTWFALLASWARRRVNNTAQTVGPPRIHVRT